jgi:hypothetical protein
MAKKSVFTILLFLLIIVSQSLTNEPPVTRHDVFQAVDANGAATFADPNVVLEGILLNVPEEMLDPTPHYVDAVPPPFNLGGQWQIYIQGEGDDHAGTAVWMGQNYRMVSGGQNPSYTDAAWIDELCRVNHDPQTGYCFAPGDRVRVSGFWMPNRGKSNVNEQHESDPAYNFTVELIEAGAGLPQPEAVTLNQLKDASDNFQTGCEYYQGHLIRINNVWFTHPESWQPNATLTITDGVKTFPVLLGRGWGIAAGTNNLAAVFDVIGILDQEDSTLPFWEGYRIWVTNYDGNGRVLGDRGHPRGNLPGDVNRDGAVNIEDFSILTEQWLGNTPGIFGCD